MILCMGVVAGGCGSKSGTAPGGKEELPESAKRLQADMKERAAKQKAAMKRLISFLDAWMENS